MSARSFVEFARDCPIPNFLDTFVAWKETGALPVCTTHHYEILWDEIQRDKKPRKVTASPAGIYDPYKAHVPGYEELRAELEAAFEQSAAGKGKERHADERPWMEQPIHTIARTSGPGFQSGQCQKKIGEAFGMFQRGEIDKAIHEAHGAIVYAAAFAAHLRTLKRNPKE